MKKRIDLDTTSSKHKGLTGIFERLLRRFKVGMHALMMIPVYLIACSILGASLMPGIYIFRTASELTASSPALLQNFTYGFCFALGFFFYGVSMILICPAVNFIIRVKLKPWRGPYYSAEAFQWFLHNALTYMVRFTFLEFVTPSPLNIFFYKAMGMKIGKGTTINTTWISDPSLIELGDKVTLGGSVTIVAHYGQAGLLIISPVKIGSGVTIGLKSSVMGGVTIGDQAKILPHSVVLPKTTIGPGETWGGVPAVRLDTPKEISLIKNS